MTTPSPSGSALHENADPAQRAIGASELAPDSPALARLLSDPAIEVRAAAARRSTDLIGLVSAWALETDAGVRSHLAAGLARVLATTTDAAMAGALLQSDRCTDAIRCDVVRQTHDDERRRLAMGSIRDKALLVELALSGVLAQPRAAEPPLAPPSAAPVSPAQARVSAPAQSDVLLGQVAGPPAPTQSAASAQAAAPASPPSSDAPAVSATQRSQPAPPSKVPVAHEERVAERASVYVPRILQQHLVDAPQSRVWTREGSSAFIDISGFTRLSEQLASKGREGAEHVTEAIGGSFEHLMAAAYDLGGSLLKFGGDALLIWFEGEHHAERAARASLRMRTALEEVGHIQIGDADVMLRMSQGVHSGHFHFFAVGASHTELLTVGPAWTRLVEMQDAAEAGEVVLSRETAALLPVDCLGEAKGEGVLLVHEPAGDIPKIPLAARPSMPAETVAHCLAPILRSHVTAGGGTSEHRPVTVAFVHFEHTDALVRDQGDAAAAEALHQLVSIVEAATEAQDVALLATDLDADGGKLILTAGAPKATGDDEERMLLALRRIVDSQPAIPVRIGVNRGSVFAGDVGPRYRRTYTVMGDAVNLAARVMAKAEPGAIYATGSVLERSNTLFRTTEIEPFAVKGKAQPVHAWAVGEAIGSRARQVTLQKLPLTGRNAELALVRKGLASAHKGSGRMVEIVGDRGFGKTRLLEALRDLAAANFRKLRGTCEAYTQSTPYVVWRDLLRELLQIGRDEADAAVVERLQATIAEKAPDLAPWLPLVAAAFGVEVAPTPEVEMLAERFRRTRLHESVLRFLEATVPDRTIFEIDDVHHMDEASADLLSYLIGQVGTHPWLLAIARRPVDTGFIAPESPSVDHVPLKPLSSQDSLRMTQLAAEQHPLPAHVLEVVAQRSGGNPQFLRDLMQSAIQSGGTVSLPESAEAATMARIDALSPEDRAVVRRASVLGLSFHPRMLAWFSYEDDDDDIPQPDEGTWDRLRDLFDDDGEGYLRFRQSLLRDTAYEGLPFKLRRRLHGTVARHIEEETDPPEEAAATLSLHYLIAGDHPAAWRYSTLAARRAEAAFAFVEAAALFGRALEASGHVPDLPPAEIATVREALADAWYRTGEYRKASDEFAIARETFGNDPIAQSRILLKVARLNEKLGKYPDALHWAELSREAVKGVDGVDAAKAAVQASACYATVLQNQGRLNEAIEWGERTVQEARASGDPEAVGMGYFVLGAAYGALGREGGEAMLKNALEAFQAAGNLVMQSATLGNIGVICQAEGRWDDATDYYERGRQESLKVGNVVAAAIARINVGEILTERGEFPQAEQILLETVPLWRTTQHRFFHGACLLLLGRISLATGKHAEALERLNEAKTHFAEVGADGEVPLVEARIAECELLRGNREGCLEIVTRLLASRDAQGVAKMASLLERLRAYTLIQEGDPFTAREALEAGLESARARKDLLEVVLTLTALAEMDRLDGVEPAPEVIAESRELVSRLKIHTLPPMPQLSQ